jgi:hypothetical protein
VAGVLTSISKSAMTFPTKQTAWMALRIACGPGDQTIRTWDLIVEGRILRRDGNPTDLYYRMLPQFECASDCRHNRLN